jgi:predicted secreted protein
VPEFGTLLHADAEETRQGMESSPTTITFFPHDHGREVAVPVGSTVILRLEAIPGAGYGWQLSRNESPQLRLVSPPVFEPRSSAEAGGIEDEVFQFRVQMPGTTDLELHYRRPSDSRGPAAKTFKIRITSE